MDRCVVECYQDEYVYIEYVKDKAMYCYSGVVVDIDDENMVIGNAGNGATYTYTIPLESIYDIELARRDHE